MLNCPQILHSVGILRGFTHKNKFIQVEMYNVGGYGLGWNRRRRSATSWLGWS